MNRIEAKEAAIFLDNFAKGVPIFERVGYSWVTVKDMVIGDGPLSYRYAIQDRDFEARKAYILDEPIEFLQGGEWNLWNRSYEPRWLDPTMGFRRKDTR